MTTTTAPLPETLGAPCWIVADGYPRGDGPHFEQEADANSTGEPYRRAASPCWVARCACGETIGQSDDYDQIHYRSFAEAQAAIEAADGMCAYCDGEGDHAVFVNPNA